MTAAIGREQTDAQARADEAAVAKRGFDDRIPALDGVRGLAVILVMAFHFSIFTEVPSSTVVDKFVFQVVGTGWIGMDIFFVLSGFLITGILFDAKAAGAVNYFRNFYARRCLRIFPAHYAFLLFFVLLFPLLWPMEKGTIAAITGDWEWFAGYVANIRIALDHGKRPDLYLTGHLWSLSVEEQFYLVWPFFVLLLSRRKLMAVCGMATLVALLTRIGMVTSGVNTWVPYTLAVTRMDALAIGALVALAVREQGDPRLFRRWLFPFALVAGALITIPALAQGELYVFDDWVRMVDHTALAVLCGFAILTVATSLGGSPLDGVLSHRSLTTIGKYSYCMYLVHVPVAYGLFRYFDIGPAIPTLLGSHLPGQVAFAVAAFLPTLAIGWLSWHLVEKQFLKFKALFPYARAA